ncbi:MAG: phosphoserine phosphatase [Clostridiales bacterium]|jgi:sigma-B regulation protein RsbU (phosphoserine phosphatase)|nr:phosphoserine phosphatase [Clostridiales bacterium]
MESKPRSSLGRKTIIGIVLFALMLIIVVCVTVGIGTYYQRVNEYNRQAYNYTRSAADYIDGDRIPGYIETGEKDDYYYMIRDYLNSTQKETAIKYFYVYVPYEDDLVYVWDADTEEGYCELGEHENYMVGGKEATEEVFRKDPPEKLKLTKDDKYGYIASAFTPIFNSAGDPVAVAAVDLYVPDLKRSIARSMVVIFLLIAAVSDLMMAVSYVVIQKKVLRPIGILNDKAGEIIDNLEADKSIDIDIHTNDELETLAESFVKMDDELRTYIRELGAVTAEKERIGAELNIATKIQAGMLPRIFPPFPEREEFELYASMNPAKEVGGDFYDFFLVDEDHLALVIADVSGKGVPAALFMVIAKVLIKNFALQGLSTSEILKKVNDRLCESNDTGFFVTVWIAIVDLTTGDGIASNAGHEHPALWRQKDKSFELVKYKHSLAVAAMDGMKFEEHGFHLDPGDMLYVYTDGVTEAANRSNELFGEERLCDTLNRSGGDAPGKVIGDVSAAIDSFVDGADQFDDITMLAMKYEGPKKD